MESGRDLEGGGGLTKVTLLLTLANIFIFRNWRLTLNARMTIVALLKMAANLR